MTLFSSNPDYGEATEELAATYDGEALNTDSCPLSPDVFSVMDARRFPCKWILPSALLDQESESPGFKCVVMPIKI